MFDLEQSIAEWRRQMLAVGIKSPVPLEELEIHLREEIEARVQSGASEQQAFGIAVGKIGQPAELKSEFKKVSAPMEMQKLIKLAGLTCVGVTLFCPLSIFLPILLDHRVSLMPKMLAVAVYAITAATIILSWRYNHKLLPVIRNQRLRRAVGMACFVGCLLWIRFVLFHLPTGNILLNAFLFGLEWTVTAILGGVSYGLEKAARARTATVDS